MSEIKNVCKKCSKNVKVPFFYCFTCREEINAGAKDLKKCISCDKKVKDPFIKCFNCNQLNKMTNYKNFLTL